MGWVRSLVRASAIVAAVGVAVPQAAAAQNLFDLLFGGPIKKRRDIAAPAPPAPAPVKPVRISAPKYYTYKTDPVRPVDFGRLTAAPRNVVFAPGALDPFAEAIPGLDGFTLSAEPDIAAAVIDWYGSNPAFLWVSGSAPNRRAADAVRALADAGRWGLDPAEYAVDVPPAGFDASAMAARNATLIRFEMALSARLLRYVRDVSVGRIDPNRISGYHDLPVKPVNLAGVMRSLALSPDIAAYLLSRQPAMAQYQDLVAELEALSAAEDDTVTVTVNGVIKPGQSNQELPKIVALMRRKGDPAFLAAHGAALDAHGAGEVYDPALVDAVKAAQKAAGLASDGVIGPRTIQALAGTSKADRITKVKVALEQLRWLPHDFEARRVFINQASFTVDYFDKGAEALSMRVVVGKPSNQTSFFIDEIERVEFNPYWGVPASILVNEMLPKLRADPSYLDRLGYEVVDAKGRRVSSSSVNWGAYGAKVPYGVRQTPGDDNALGELKILFPNRHDIYMHDTPAKDLFKRDSRAFSHGCVRLERPRDMAAAVLGWSTDAIAAKLKQGHSGVDVPQKIPVYVTYFTAWPGKDGRIGYFADIYERDAHVLDAMKRVATERAGSG